MWMPLHRDNCIWHYIIWNAQIYLNSQYTNITNIMKVYFRILISFCIAFNYVTNIGAYSRESLIRAFITLIRIS